MWDTGKYPYSPYIYNFKCNDFDWSFSGEGNIPVAANLEANWL